MSNPVLNRRKYFIKGSYLLLSTESSRSLRTFFCISKSDFSTIWMLGSKMKFLEGSKRQFRLLFQVFRGITLT